LTHTVHTYQISFNLEKLLVDAQTDGRMLRPALLARLNTELRAVSSRWLEEQR